MRMSHKLLFYVCIHASRIQENIFVLPGPGEHIAVLFQTVPMYHAHMLSFNHSRFNIDWVITALQALLKAIKIICPKSLQSSPSLYSPWTVAQPFPLSLGLSSQEYCSMLSFPPPGIFPTQESNLHLMSPALAAGSLPIELHGKPRTTVPDRTADRE